MGTVLCIGEALIDMICIEPGASLQAGERFLKKTGGAPTNVAAAIAAFGGASALAAKVGNDPFGHQLIAEMRRFGVDTRWMLIDESRFTTMAFVSLMEDGERDFYFNRGADGQLSVDDIERIDLTGVALVHFGSATAFLPGPLQLAYTRLLERALEKQISVSFDPNYRHLLFRNDRESFIRQSKAFLGCCDFFKVSDEEAMLLTGTSDLDSAVAQLLRYEQAVFAVTIGMDGTLLGMGGSITQVPSIPVQAVDTTGAGDAFVGALLYQLAELPASGKIGHNRQQWVRMVEKANRAGARTCEYHGAMEAFAKLNQSVFD